MYSSVISAFWMENVCVGGWLGVGEGGWSVVFGWKIKKLYR